MPRLKPSFINEIREQLDVSGFTKQDFDLEFPDSGRTLASIAFKYKPSYSLVLNEEERVDLFTIEQKLTLSSQTKRVKETHYWVRAIPGRVKTEDIYDIDGPQSFVREIPTWCANLREDILAATTRIDPLEELRKKLQDSIDEVVTDPDANFTFEELKVVDSRFDELYDEIVSLNEKFAITKDQLKELRKEFDNFKQTARTYPKGIWAKVTGNKLVRATGRIINTPEGRTFLIKQLQRALGLSGD